MQTLVRTANTEHRPFAAQPSTTQPAACPFAQAQTLPAVTALAGWRSSLTAADFPYEAVVSEIRRVGKHSVATALLEALAQVRKDLPAVRGAADEVRCLERWLDNALDKWDNRYANPTYLGLNLLPLPTLENDDDIRLTARRYDRLLTQLMADVARFEIAAAAGETDELPQMRPDARTTEKRCRLVWQIAAPAAARLGWVDEVAGEDAVGTARRLWAMAADTMSPLERDTLRITMLPVSLVHDEYQFIRILQAFEATFALAAVHLHAAIRALGSGDAETARQGIEAAETALHEAAPLFSLVATMQVEAFHTFREFTEGASAIQSRNYKLMESLCRQPDTARLDAPAYTSVPEVRQRVLAGQATLDEAVQAARAAGDLNSDDLAGLEAAMQRYAATLVRWRRTHHSIAVRMLGEKTGTGYTEGSAYLKSVIAIPVFSSLSQDAEGQENAAPSSGDDGKRGRCPFAHGGNSHAMMPAAGGA